jgi:DNA-binding NarL/FixJ family response regulator
MMSSSSEALITVVIGQLDGRTLQEFKRTLARDDRVLVLAAGVENELLPTTVARRSPTVVLMDEGIEYSLLRRVKECQPGPAVLICAEHVLPTLLRTWLRAQDGDYVLRSASPAELLAAVHLLASARSDPEMVQPLEDQLRLDLSLLTDREYEVLKYMSLGWSYPRIAAEMHLATSTIKSHSASVRRHLGVERKADLTGLSIPQRPASGREV